MTEFSNFITKIKPIEQPQQEELDRYYVEHVSLCMTMEICHTRN